MLPVLVVLALIWGSLALAICAICAVGGAADEQSEAWYREHMKTTEEVDQDERGAA
jgi:hypothetical protein